MRSASIIAFYRYLALKDRLNIIGDIKFLKLVPQMAPEGKRPEVLDSDNLSFSPSRGQMEIGGKGGISFSVARGKKSSERERDISKILQSANISTVFGRVQN